MSCRNRDFKNHKVTEDRGGQFYQIHVGKHQEEQRPSESSVVRQNHVVIIVSIILLEHSTLMPLFLQHPYIRAVFCPLVDNLR